MQRLSGVAELLDLGVGDPAAVRANLAELDRINLWLGGWSALKRHVRPLTEAGSSLLDVGCGAAPLARRLHAWSERRGRRLRITGLDLAARNLRAARDAVDPIAQVSLVRGDLFHPPFAPRSFDFVYSTLVLHHLEPEAAIGALRSMAQLARRRLIVNDLVRSPSALALFRWSSPILARHWITQHDGELSIRRAYTAPELRGLLRRAGFPQARVHEDALTFRMTGVIDLA